MYALVEFLSAPVMIRAKNAKVTVAATTTVRTDLYATNWVERPKMLARLRFQVSILSFSKAIYLFMTGTHFQSFCNE